MAIIRGDAGSEDTAFEAGARPALLVRDDWVQENIQGYWQPFLEPNKVKIECAIAGTARLETSDHTLPYVGTAFAVGRRLAMTTRHLAEIVRIGIASGPASRSYWLNFKAEHNSDEVYKKQVRGIAFTHPTLDCALLELEDVVEPERVIPLSRTPSSPGLPIGVIGYPAFDVRNDRSVQSRCFNSIYGVKRFMPGSVTGSKLQRPFGKDVLAITHDASTLGGTGGAPVIDLHTGLVVAVNSGGEYLVANYAVAADSLAETIDLLNIGALSYSSSKPYEPNNSSSLLRVEGGSANTIIQESRGETDVDISDEELPRSLMGARVRENLENIFNIDDIAKLHEVLVDSGFGDDAALLSLFYGLPPAFIAALPSGNNAIEKLFNRLHYLNRFGSFIEYENHTPFYLLLMTAKSLRRSQTDTVESLARFFEQVKDAEARALKVMKRKARRN